MKEKMRWIKSAGGPLIFAESEPALHWCGVYGSNCAGYSQSKDPTDYDRACMTTNYLEVTNFSGRSALILGDMPLETTICRLTKKSFLVIRAFYAESDFNPTLLVEDEQICNFSDPIEFLKFDVQQGNMIMFDSACKASEAHQKLEYDTASGHYQILTKLFVPDNRTSLLIHKFNWEREIVSAH